MTSTLVLSCHLLHWNLFLHAERGNAQTSLATPVKEITTLSGHTCRAKNVRTTHLDSLNGPVSNTSSPSTSSTQTRNESKNIFVETLSPSATYLGQNQNLALEYLISKPWLNNTQRNLDVSENDWPQFRGNAQLTGASDSMVPSELKLLWTYDAGETIDSSAAIVNGMVYVGTYNGELLVIDLETGKLQWTYQASVVGIGESSPAVDKDTVYIGDLSGVIHAVSLTNGKAKWTFQTDGEIRSSPVLVDDRVLIGSYDGHLYALTTSGGKLIWKFETSNYVHGTPAIADGIAYFGGCDELFRGIRIADGKEIFSLSSGAYTAASPALHNGFAYYGTFNNEVLSLDLSRRRVLWRYEHPDRHFPFYSSPLVTDDRIVIGGRDRMIHAIDARTGEALWTFMTRSRVDSSPASANGRVYVGSNDGRLYVLDLEHGKKLWEFEVGAPFSTSVAIADGKIVLGSQDGQLYCFG